MPVSANAASVPPMTAMHYYVGRWACMGGPAGAPATRATASYTLVAGVLAERIIVPPFDGMTTPLGIEQATAWDATTRRYVTTGMRTDGYWWAVKASRMTGDTESWNDIASDAPLGREVIVRLNRNTYSYKAYSTAGHVNFVSTCKRVVPAGCDS